VNDTRYASRKFVLACATFLAGVTFYALGKMTSPEWLSYSQWILGLYLAANVGDQAVTRT
jgi:hypothetical protein